MKIKTINCKVCGLAFEAKDPRRIYCSAKCNDRSKTLRRQRLVFDDRSCDQCGTVFTPDRTTNRFCSEHCKTTWGNNHKAFPGVCLKCGKPFVSKLRRTRFCSLSCGLSVEVKKILTCRDCGKEFEFVGRSRKHRCPACHKNYWNAYYHAAEDGLKANWYRENHWRWRHDSTYRRTVRALPGELRYKYRNICYDYWPRKCAICGEDTPHRIDVHHIDGNRVNYTIVNLVPLCKTHHGTVHTCARKLNKQPTEEQYREALFMIWPEGRQVIGALAQQCASKNIANSVNALPVMGRANTELGSQEPSVETVHDTPHAGDEPVQRTNIDVVDMVVKTKLV